MFVYNLHVFMYSSPKHVPHLQQRPLDSYGCNTMRVHLSQINSLLRVKIPIQQTFYFFIPCHVSVMSIVNTLKGLNPRLENTVHYLSTLAKKNDKKNRKNFLTTVLVQDVIQKQHSAMVTKYVLLPTCLMIESSTETKGCHGNMSLLLNSLHKLILEYSVRVAIKVCISCPESKFKNQTKLF